MVFSEAKAGAMTVTGDHRRDISVNTGDTHGYKKRNLKTTQEAGEGNNLVYVTCNALKWYNLVYCISVSYLERYWLSHLSLIICFR